jgi:uncharacterized protein DUF2800
MMGNTHADASPSSASIWLKCPASVTLARGKKRLPSPYTREGTAAHEAAERIIHGLPAPTEVTVDGEAIQIDEEMLDHVEVYTKYVDELRKRTKWFAVETQIKLLDLPEPLFGTADAMAYDYFNQTLEVVDLKYGKGVSVAVENNPQLKIYGLGGLRTFKDRVKFVKLTVVQPRTTGPGVQSVTLGVGELWLWQADTLEPALQRIADNDSTETPGPHCRWCVRAGECKALAAMAQMEARTAFADDPAKLVAGLSNADLSQALDKAELVVAWVNLIRAEASQRADKGETIPHWKLVPKRAMRKWTDDNAALATLNIAGIPLHEVVKIVSVAAAERAMKTHKKDMKPLLPLITKESSGTTLVRDDDSRDGVDMSAKGVFKALA